MIKSQTKIEVVRLRKKDFFLFVIFLSFGDY